MVKTFTTSQIREIGGELFSEWESNKNEIKIKGRALYSLISLKKTLEQKLIVIEETIAALAAQYGAIAQENGSLVIPEDKREEAGKALMELGNETIEIDFETIALDELSAIPIGIYEILFDFISFKD